MRPELVVVRGGGDLATGIVWRLWRARFPVIVCELPEPLTVRRTVAVSSAVRDGSVSVEGMPARCATSLDEAVAVARSGVVAVVVSPDLPAVAAEVVVDARVAKRNLGTRIDDAPLVIGIGPGFEVGVDVDAVVETQRGPRLGRLLVTGSAAPDTGVPGEIGGRSAERVLRAPAAGSVHWEVAIGDVVRAGQQLGTVADRPVLAPFDGVVRGAIAPGTSVRAGLKIADLDPRADVDCTEISDKALSVGGGVMEAVLAWISGDS